MKEQLPILLLHAISNVYTIAIFCNLIVNFLN